MTAVLTLALVVVAILLLSFAGRLGLSGGLDLALIPILLGLGVLFIGLVSATSRLNVYLDASDRKSILWPFSMQLVLLLSGLALLPNFGPAEPRSGGALLVAYVLTMLLVPAREPVSLLPRPERRMGGADRALIVGFVTAGFALLLFLLWFEPVLSWLSRASGLSAAPFRISALVALAVLVLLGGLAALLRLAAGALILASLFAGLPLLLAAAVEILRQAGPWDVAAGGAAASALLPGMAAFAQDAAFWQAAAMGTGLGLVGLASVPGLRGPLRRGGFGGVVAVLAAGLALVIEREAQVLHGLVIRELVPVAPQNWPLFVFDEAIRGWLKVCSFAPRDAIDVIQECRRQGVTATIPPEMFEIRPDLVGPALAVSRGLPVTFGLVSGLVGPLFAFLSLGLLLHVAASGLSELLLFRLFKPGALRAARLVRARLMAIALLSAFVLVPGFPPDFDPRITGWLSLSLALLLAVTVLADGLLCLLRRRPTSGMKTPIAT